jgi:cytochrome c-type biogenesis protein CcmH/NrfG
VGSTDEGRLGPRPRVALAVVLAVVGLASIAGLAGNSQASRATNAYRGGEWAAAARDASRAASWQPWSGQPWRVLGEARLAQGRFAEARAAFRTGIEREPGDWQLWFDLARATTGNAQRQALQRAAQLNPRSPELADLRREIRAGRMLSDEIAA